VLEDKAALDVYATHNVHVQVKTTYISPIVEEVIALDFVDTPRSDSAGAAAAASAAAIPPPVQTAPSAAPPTKSSCQWIWPSGVAAAAIAGFVLGKMWH